MAIITFWSNRKKETAQTLSLIALASYLAVEHNSRILVVDLNFNDTTLERAYWTDREVENRKALELLNAGKVDIGTGIDGLSKLIASGRDIGDQITNYSRVVYRGRLETIPSYKPTSIEDRNRIMGTYRDLIKFASPHYDHVFVDSPKGTDSEWVNEILNLSDVIVFNLTQRLSDMEEYIKLKNENPIFKKGNVLPLIGRYDRYSKYTKKNIARFMGEKKEIPAISYNTLFFEAANEGQIGTYFLKFRKSLISSTDRNVGFIDEVEKAGERLILKVQEVAMMR